MRFMACWFPASMFMYYLAITIFAYACRQIASSQIARQKTIQLALIQLTCLQLGFCRSTVLQNPFAGNSYNNLCCCIQLYINIYIYIYIYIYLYIYIYINASTCVYIYIYIYIRISTDLFQRESMLEYSRVPKNRTHGYILKLYPGLRLISYPGTCHQIPAGMYYQVLRYPGTQY